MNLFWNFVKAFVRAQWAKFWGYEILACPYVVDERFAQCIKCPFFDGAQCLKCGCLAEAKVMILVEKCPDNRWPAFWRKKLTPKRPSATN